MQSLGLLGNTLEPEPVARFLRHCPGLSKQTIGDLLGENDQFFLDVLDAFTATFSFRGGRKLPSDKCHLGQPLPVASQVRQLNSTLSPPSRQLGTCWAWRTNSSWMCSTPSLLPSASWVPAVTAPSLSTALQEAAVLRRPLPPLYACAAQGLDPDRWTACLLLGPRSWGPTASGRFACRAGL